VNVGVDQDTSALAVASIRRWWSARGAGDYPGARRLLITADAGGSHSYRYRPWKAELAVFAAETGLTITVCHSRRAPRSGTRSSIGCSPRSP
jgi:DDE family transposase